MSRRSLVFLVAAACGHGHNGDRVTGDDAPGGGSDAPGDTPGAMVDADPACPTPGVLPAMHAEVVVSGLTQPMFATQPPGSTDLYVAEKTGRIKIVRNHAVAATFLDLSGVVNIPTAQAEGGLLSIAFAEDYVTSGRFFVFMTVAGSQLVVREYHRMATDVANPTPVQDLITIPNDGYNNIGGTIAFGPDHYLWVGTGDRTDGTTNDAADITTRLGKILRVDADNPGTPPAGNLGGGADPYVWDYGLRNPFRWSFDPKTNNLYIADAGDTKVEEVDLETPSMGQRDYGWPRMEGNVCHANVASCPPPGTLPAYVRPHQTDFSVIIGGVVYRGAAMPCLRGRYIFGIYGTTGHVLSWVWNGTAVTSELELTDMLAAADTNNIVNYGVDRAGEVYLVALTGAVYKLVPN